MVIRCFLALALTLAPATTDFYPEVRSLLLEAETALPGNLVMQDKSRPLQTLASLLARAGYLQDAMRVGAKAGVPPEDFGFPQTLYGDLDGALKAVAAMSDPVRRTNRFTDVAGVLWRMGDRVNAAKVLDQAERSAQSIPDAARQKLPLQLIAQQRQALPNEPPIPLSPTPHRETPVAASSAVPPFPITVEGFRDQNLSDTTKQVKEDEGYLAQLYALVAARNSVELREHVEDASTPFQKTLGFASLEHLFIQLGTLDLADQSARAIPDDSADCSLAKVEALTAVGIAWVKKGDTERANADFDTAWQVTTSIRTELSFGKTVVTLAIAVAEAKSGMPTSSNRIVESALMFATQVPPRPTLPANRVYPKNYFSGHFRDGAYSRVFESAMTLNNLDIARKTVDLWQNSDVFGVQGDIADAWFDAGRKDEAISYARSLKDRTDRGVALLRLARRLLDQAGAPLI